jgi:Glycosyl transferase family 2
MRLSMVMIARDERENVGPCFDSFWNHVDEVVLCDTGSGDGTVAEAERYAAERGEPEKLIVGHFAWCDDFAAARNHAHSLASGDVHAWMDLDDRMQGGEHLRTEAGRLFSEPKFDIILALWSGPITPEMWRPCMMRAPVSWTGATWETPLEVGRQATAPKIRLHHTREQSHGRRDLDIALRWATQDPGNYRPLLAAGIEAASNSEWELAADCASRGLAQSEVPELIRGRFCLLWAKAFYAQADPKEAEGMARLAIDWARPHVRTLRDLREGVKGDRQLDLGGDIFQAWELRGRCALERDDPAEAMRCAMESTQHAATEEQLKLAAANAQHLVTLIASRAAREGVSGKPGAATDALRSAHRFVREQLANVGPRLEATAGGQCRHRPEARGRRMRRERGADTRGGQ